MTVYLIHAERPLHHAQHYVGWASDLDRRIAHHRNGTGARLMAAFNAAGIAWRVVRTWPGGDKRLERRIKNRGGHARVCPVCKGESR